jgi:hypothetical protein
MPDLVYDTNETALKLQVQAITTGSTQTLTGEKTIDGVSLVGGDRVILKDQGNAENGIWVVDAGSWIRADDFTGNQLDRRTSIFVKQGSQYAGTTWEITNSSTAVIGYDTLTFSLRTSPITAIGTEETDPDGTEYFHIEDAGSDKYISISNADEGMTISSTADPDANDDSAGTGGNGECHVGRRWVNTNSNSAFVSVDSSTGGAVWNEIPYNTYNKTAAPTTNDDASGTAGNGTFSVGSVWIDLTDNVEWVCVDDTAAAAQWNRRVYDYTSTTSPTTNDDDANTSGNGVFQLGSQWVDSTKNSAYVLTDPSSGGAVWNQIPYSTYNKTAAPTTNDDAAGTAGTVYTVGSVWVDTTDNIEWVCVDDTATAAIWNRRVYDFTTTTDPTVNDDDTNTSGNGVFQAGSQWTNTTSGEVFVLTDATATAAVWLNLEPHRRRTINTIKTNTTLTSTYRYVICDASTAAANPTLPLGSSAEDYIISAIDVTNGVSVIPSSNQTIGVLDSTSWPLSKGETLHLFHDPSSTSPSTSGRWEVQ